MLERLMITYFRRDTSGKLRSSALIAPFSGTLALPQVVRAQTTSIIEGTVTDKQGLRDCGVEKWYEPALHRVWAPRPVPA